MSGQSLQRLSDFLYPRAATSSSPKKAVGSLKIKIHSTVNHVLHSQHKVHAVVKQGVAIPTLTRAALSIAFIFFFLFLFFSLPLTGVHDREGNRLLWRLFGPAG